MELILSAFCGGKVRGQGSLNYYGKRANGTAIIRGSDESYRWRDQVTGVLKARMPLDHVALDQSVPIAAAFLFVYERPKNHYRTNGELKDWAPHYTTSGGIDVDKSARLVNDALTNSGLIHDDKQIVLNRAEKIYVNDEHSQPGVHIDVWRLDR